MPSDYTLEQVTDIYGKRLDLHREELDALKRDALTKTDLADEGFDAQLGISFKRIEDRLDQLERPGRIRRPQFPWRLRIERRSL